MCSNMQRSAAMCNLVQQCATFSSLVLQLPMLEGVET
jgi:hypothetical protein